jgi:hypothetical protein
VNLDASGPRNIPKQF